MIKIFYNLETTGLNPNKHGIHQIAGFVERDGKIVETFDIKTRPNPRAKIDPSALQVCKITEEEILSYSPMEVQYRSFIELLGRYIDPYNPKDKTYLVGFNNSAFDDIFLAAWFKQNGDNFFTSWFWPGSLDVMVLASQYLLDRRERMPNFKLASVARELGIRTDTDKLHEGLYEVYLTREIYNTITGIEEEL